MSTHGVGNFPEVWKSTLDIHDDLDGGGQSWWRFAVICDLDVQHVLFLCLVV